MGKGSTRRPAQVSRAKYAESWDKVFSRDRQSEDTAAAATDEGYSKARKEEKEERGDVRDK